METNVISLKNMVCNRCILSVEKILENLNINFVKVNLGMILLHEKISDEKVVEFKKNIEKIGFEILVNKDSIIVEKVKQIILDTINSREFRFKKNSKLIEESLGMNYSKISNLFSYLEGKTIEKFIIELKIEKVKELILYGELSVAEISYELGYATPQYLSRQFKQITGLTTLEFRQLGKRKELDKI